MINLVTLLSGITKLISLIAGWFRDQQLVQQGRDLQTGDNNAALVKFHQAKDRIDDAWANNPADRERVRKAFDGSRDTQGADLLLNVQDSAEVSGRHMPHQPVQVHMPMSNRFSKTSATRLQTCDNKLVELFNEVIKHIDCSILFGHRDQIEQNKAFADGKSKLKWPHSKHNSKPSRAVDAAPYPIDWANTQRFVYFAGFVMGMAAARGIKLRWGGDWNRNYDPMDESFRDLVHFELEDKDEGMGSRAKD